MRAYSSSLLERLVASCFAVLAGVIALVVAVHLLEAIWPILLGIGLGVAVAAGGLAVLRWRRQGW